MLTNLFAVRDHRVSNSKRATLHYSLTCRPKHSFAARSDAYRNARDGRGSHTKNVRVEIVRMDHVNLVLFQKLREAAELASGVKIVKTIQSKFRNVVQTQSLEILEQHSLAIKCCNKDVASARFQQQSRELDRLSFGSALMETGYEL